MDTGKSDLRTLQRERTALAQARAAAKLLKVAPSERANTLVSAAQRARTLEQRVIWLQRAASAWAEPMEAIAACRQGCSHCCHVPVTISRAEAALLARASGRRAARPVHGVRPDALATEAEVIAAQQRLQDRPSPSPCPFLGDAQCTVYAHRPMACRVLLNLDDDELLCRLTHDADHSDAAPAPEAQVPYADARALKALALAAQASSEFADIRDFFPA